MSFRRNHSVRQGARRPSDSPVEEDVENPNAFGPFGHHYEAPAAVAVAEHEYDEFTAHGQAHDGGHHHQYHHQYQQYYEPQHHDSDDNASRQQTGWHNVEVQPQHGVSDHYRSSSPSSQQPLTVQQDMYADHRQAYMQQPHHQYSAQREDSASYLQNPTQSQTKLGRFPSMSPQMSTQEQLHHHHHPGESAFELVHGAKSGGHLHQYGSDIPIHWRHLFKRPVIRQWVLQDKLYREEDERVPAQFELFWDLTMVGVIHVIGHGAAEEASGLNVVKFVLLFYPAWSIWTDVRNYINVSGTDDVLQRVYLLLSMVLLIGYCANATGIIIEKAHDTVAEVAALGTGAAELDTVHKRAIMTAVGAAGTLLAKRASSAASTEEVILVREIGHTGFWFASGWHAAIVSAIGFYLCAKFCRLFLFFIYGLLLPKFRKALFLNMISLIFISAIYIPIIFITEPGYIVILFCAGMVFELSSRFMVAAVMQYLHGYAKHKGHKTYMPAYSLPHLMERMTQFTILVVGETIINSTYIAYSGQYGPQGMFLRSSLCVVISFMLIWLYFDNDGSRTFVHGLKRHWFASISFTHLHFPLCAAFILMSGALIKLIAQEAVEISYLWYFSGSLSTVMACIGLLGMLHKSLDVWGSSIVPRSARIGVRFILAALFACMPVIHHWKSAEFLAVHAAILTGAVLFETMGKLGSVGRKYDAVRAAELRQRRKEASTGELDDSFAMSGVGGHAEKKHMKRLSVSANEIIQTAARKLHKDGAVKGPGRRASWHEYDDLTGPERGEEDVGVESELGKLEVKEVSSGERWAYVAT